MYAWSRAQLPPRVTYTSSRPDVVSAAGRVIRPAFGSGPALVEIAAHVITAGAVDVRRAVVRVLQAPPPGGDAARDARCSS